jgi:hypothetical protein
LEVVRSIAEERKIRMLNLLRGELSYKEARSHKAVKSKSQQNLHTDLFHNNNCNEKNSVKRDRAKSLEADKVVDHFLKVRKNVPTASATEGQKRRKSLNDFVSEKLSSACQRSFEFGKLKVSLSASHILTSDSSGGRKALKGWLMSIQKGLLTSCDVMSPEQSIMAICGEEQIFGSDKR